MNNKTQTPHIPLIIPCYEPDDRLISLLDALKSNGFNNIILINDGSSSEYDHYFDDAESTYGCTVLKHFVNLGKGRALKDAFNFCLNSDPSLIGCVTADSDGQHTPDDIYAIMSELEVKPDNLILGCRDFSSDNVPRKSYLGNTITRRVCKFLCGVNVSDTQTGLRGIPKAFMSELLDTAGERFEFETRMLIETKDAYEITEVSIETVYDSTENHQTHFDPLRDSIRIYKIFGGIFMKFIISSLSSCILDLILFHIFCGVFKDIYTAAYITIATVVARVISATYNYTINYAFVFHSKEAKSTSLGKYALLAAVQMLLSAALVTLALHIIPVSHEVIIKAIVDTILFFLSYYIQRTLVFKR